MSTYVTVSKGQAGKGLKRFDVPVDQSRLTRPDFLQICRTFDRERDTISPRIRKFGHCATERTESEE